MKTASLRGPWGLCHHVRNKRCVVCCVYRRQSLDLDVHDDDPGPVERVTIGTHSTLLMSVLEVRGSWGIQHSVSALDFSIGFRQCNVNGLAGMRPCWPTTTAERIRILLICLQGGGG